MEMTGDAWIYMGSKLWSPWWRLCVLPATQSQPPLFALYYFGKYVALRPLLKPSATDAEGRYIKPLCILSLPDAKGCASGWDARDCSKTSISDELGMRISCHPITMKKAKRKKTISRFDYCIFFAPHNKPFWLVNCAVEFRILLQRLVTGSESWVM